MKVWIALDEEASSAYRVQPDLFPPPEPHALQYVKSCLAYFPFESKGIPLSLPSRVDRYLSERERETAAAARKELGGWIAAELHENVPAHVRPTTWFDSDTIRRRPAHMVVWLEENAGESKRLVDDRTPLVASDPFYVLSPPSTMDMTSPSEYLSLQLYHDICSLWGPLPSSHSSSSSSSSSSTSTRLPPPMLERTRVADLTNHLRPWLRDHPSVKELIERVLQPRTMSSPSSTTHRFPSGVCLWGPPGTGKSTVARAILKHAGVRPLWCGTASELSCKYIGETERKLRTIISACRQTPRLLCSVQIDEIDALVPRRGEGGGSGGAVSSEAKVDWTSEMLALVERERFPNLLVIFTTNRRASIEPALLRPPRVSDHFFFGRLSCAARQSVIERLFTPSYLLGRCWCALDAIKMEAALDLTYNFSGALLEDVVDKYTAARQRSGLSVWDSSGATLFLDVVRTVRRAASLSDDDIVSSLCDEETHRALSLYVAKVVDPSVIPLVTSTVDSLSSTSTSSSSSACRIQGATWDSAHGRFDLYLESGRVPLQLIPDDLKTASTECKTIKTTPTCEVMETALTCLARMMEFDIVLRVDARRLRAWDEASMTDACEQLRLECGEYVHGVGRGGGDGVRGVLVIVNLDDVVGVVEHTTRTRGKERSLDHDSKQTQRWSESDSENIEPLRPMALHALTTLSTRLADLSRCVLVLEGRDTRLRTLAVRTLGWGSTLDRTPWRGWDTTRLPRYLTSPDGLQVVCSGGAGTMIGDRPLEYGRHCWSIRVDRTISRRILFGVIGHLSVYKPDVALDSQPVGVDRWFCRLSDGTVHAPGCVPGRKVGVGTRVSPPAFQQISRPIGMGTTTAATAVGDTWSLYLDLTPAHGILLLYVNGVYQYLIASGLTGPLYPAVSLFDAQDRVTLRIHDRLPAPLPECWSLPLPRLWNTSRSSAHLVTVDGVSATLRAAACQTLLTTLPILPTASPAQTVWGIRLNSGTSGLTIGLASHLKETKTSHPSVLDCPIRPLSNWETGTAESLSFSKGAIWLGKRKEPLADKDGKLPEPVRGDSLLFTHSWTDDKWNVHLTVRYTHPKVVSRSTLLFFVIDPRPIYPAVSLESLGASVTLLHT